MALPEDATRGVSKVNSRVCLPWQAGDRARVRSAGALSRVAELLREFHDLTTGTALAGPAEVVCHNDLSPKNTVYRNLADGLRPVAFIDWLLCDAYRLDERIAVLDTILWWQDRCWRGIESAAQAGEATVVRLRDSGTCAQIRRAYDWVHQNLPALQAPIG